ncbi:MAG TPA: alpha-galactosidase, partial [Terriglobales bacterium]
MKIKPRFRSKRTAAILVLTIICFCGLGIQTRAATAASKIENAELRVEISQQTGLYTITKQSGTAAHLTAGVAAKINGHWVHSSDYPKHSSNSTGDDTLMVTYSGLAGQPDLLCSIRLNSNPDYVELSASVQNTTGKQFEVQAIRSIEVTNPSGIDLGGPESADRILSDSFSEDRPQMAIHDFGDETSGLYRGVGSQLIYNRDSRNSLFVAILTSERWLTILRLHAQPRSKIASYEVDSTGTTELELENSLRSSPAEDRVELSLPINSGESISAEKLMLSLSSDYHAQLENYGKLIRELHHPRVSAPTPIGWWSWTAYYFGLNQGTALTNAKFLSEQLKDLGYKFFHIDEGYQYARGEYTTENKTNFPDGMPAFENKVQRLGLTPGIWTAPFEVSERSSVYEKHKDWLVHNAQHQPIHAGYVIGGKKLDHLYILDTTNPGAQNYLRQTYSTLVRDWGIRYIKLDFMDDAAIEGYYYRPHTTALEAQRIGLKVIREAVGENVLLDKDGSPMLNPVGLVDCGRISQDTGHTFGATHDAATGVAARYYMNRNFFIGDADAFSVSRQTLEEQAWHGGKRPLTLDEARTSIALSAVSGGMYEIGDDLPSIFMDADRMALVKNRDLIKMAKLERASIPVDLMSYAPEDELPTIFILRESKRQSILTVFNWTEKERKHELQYADLGLELKGSAQLIDVLDTGRSIEGGANSVSFTLPPRSVEVVKIIDTSISAAAPSVNAQVPTNVSVAAPEQFSATTEQDSDPVVEYRWDFGDGTRSSGAEVRHTFTHSGDFTVHLTA